jgi:hypothetical protein
MDRMGQHTKQPEVLRELFAALGNDPFVIAECLARPALAERLLTNWYAYDDRIRGELRERAETDLLTHPAVEQMKQLSGTYSEVEFVESNSSHENSKRAGHRIELNGREWDQTMQTLAATFNKSSDSKNAQRCRHGAVSPRLQAQQGQSASRQPAGYNSSALSMVAAAYQSIPTGNLSSLQEDETRFYATAILSKSADRLKLATVSWLKQPLHSWLANAENSAPLVAARVLAIRFLSCRMGRTDASMIRGQLQAPLTRPLPETFTRQCGPALK